MKQYTVYFTEPIERTYITEKQVFENGRWQMKEVEVTEKVDTVTFYSLAPAKKLIKANINKYKGSCITKIWANGDWENLGEINLKSSNKTFVANTKQRLANY